MICPALGKAFRQVGDELRAVLPSAATVVFRDDVAGAA
jgi:hypothetical protein